MRRREGSMYGKTTRDTAKGVVEESGMCLMTKGIRAL